MTDNMILMWKDLMAAMFTFIDKELLDFVFASGPQVISPESFIEHMLLEFSKYAYHKKAPKHPLRFYLPYDWTDNTERMVYSRTMKYTQKFKDRNYKIMESLSDDPKEYAELKSKPMDTIANRKEGYELTEMDFFEANTIHDLELVKAIAENRIYSSKKTSRAIEVGRLPEGKYTCPIVLKRYGLITGDYLTNAGEVLFGNTHPVTLKLAIFATNEKLTFLDMKLYEDNIYNLLKIAEDYISKNIHWRNEITGFEREEVPEIPLAVIREVLANSFAHAIYDSRTQHEICIHPDMITIYSPGDYASEHKPEEYIRRNLESELRNPNIARLLYLTRSIEKFGSGFKRIDSLCKDAGVKYSYERTKNGFKFILHRPRFISDTPNVTYDVTYGKGEALNITEQSVLAILKQDPTISREDIAEKVSKTVRTVQRALVSLTEKGYIKRVGAKKNSTWEVLK